MSKWSPKPLLRKILIFPLIIVFAASPASARDYYYFNKAGVDRETYLKDRLFCDELAGGTAVQNIDYVSVTNNNLTVGQNAAAEGIASFLIALIGGAQNRRLQWKIERICLADRGYRRFEVKKKMIRDIEKLDDEGEQVDRFFNLATQNDPVGEEMYE